MVKKKEVYEKILLLASNIVKQKKGALFIIADKNKIRRHYDLLFPQLIQGHNISEDGVIKVLENLAVLDGAVIISPSGELIAYGARIKKSKTLRGFGTRHATASGITSSVQSSIAILVSEESNLIRVFKNGNLILEMDGEIKSKSLNSKIVSFLSEGDNALITAAGASAAILGPAALLSPIVAPVIIVGGSAYLAVKAATKLMKRRMQ